MIFQISIASDGLKHFQTFQCRHLQPFQIVSNVVHCLARPTCSTCFDSVHYLVHQLHVFPKFYNCCMSNLANFLNCSSCFQLIAHMCYNLHVNRSLEYRFVIFHTHTPPKPPQPPTPPHHPSPPHPHHPPPHTLTGLRSLSTTSRKQGKIWQMAGQACQLGHSKLLTRKRSKASMQGGCQSVQSWHRRTKSRIGHLSTSSSTSTKEPAKCLVR
jgi:hypothetical protein